MLYKTSNRKSKILVIRKFFEIPKPKVVTWPKDSIHNWIQSFYVSKSYLPCSKQTDFLSVNKLTSWSGLLLSAVYCHCNPNVPFATKSSVIVVTWLMWSQMPSSKVQHIKQFRNSLQKWTNFTCTFDYDEMTLGNS